MSAAPEQRLTLDEYIAIEESSETKHEFLDGNVHEMTDFSPAHCLITANLIGSLHPQLRGKSCRMFPSTQRLKVEATGLYTYPDASVVCGPMQLAEKPNYTMTNPTVLIEVLSPSTEGYDRGMKFEHYRKIDSLRAYLLIAQDSIQVELYTRQEQNSWLLEEFTEKETMVPLDAIGCTMAIKDIYRDVEFDE